MAPSEQQQAESPFAVAVKAVLLSLHKGDVVTYGEVAAEAGYPGAARAVGNILSHGGGLPWWRVVAASGRLVPGHEKEQEALLAAEDILVIDGRVRRQRSSGRGPSTSAGLAGGPGGRAILTSS